MLGICQSRSAMTNLFRMRFSYAINKMQRWPNAFYGVFVELARRK